MSNHSDSPISELNILRVAVEHLENLRDKVVAERLGQGAIGRLFRKNDETVCITIEGEPHITDGMPVFAHSALTQVVSLPPLPEPYINEHEDAGAYYPATYSKSQMIQFAKELLINAGFEGEIKE